MEWTSLNDLREKYLSFYESKDHLRHKSFPLVPNGDKSILLINAGMTPLKKYFTGEEEPPRHRMTTCQKCIRTPDIDRVGLTARHGTFFEMLGNFSFGDYFKREAINWAWEFITEVLDLPRERLWVSVYTEDDEAYDIWNKEIGVPAERIVRLGKEDNFWEHGSGPCGPCSEIHFDRGEEYGCGSPDCKPGCDCDRFMEFWNLVFTQFDNDGHGNYSRLAKPNIDTGMGLERLACLMQGVNNLFEVDTVRNIMNAVSEKAGKKYGENDRDDIAFRVVTDHIRSTCFLISDGVVPSNEGRGYVLRRLMRRAARYGQLLGIKGLFLSDLCDVVARENITEYPELTEKLDYIKRVVLMEEERFAATIDAGLGILDTLIADAKNGGKDTLAGEDLFRLYDTFGFPIDLTREIAAEAGLGIDEEGFTALMKEQKERARSARANISGWSEGSKSLVEGLSATEFTGYCEDASSAKVIALIADGQAVEEIGEGEVTVILDRTPFYGEGGGQVGDCGTITADGVALKVLDTKKTDGVYMHVCEVENGTVKTGMTVTAAICTQRRAAIRRNHSAVHLMQAALRRVLGTHVEQKGSYVDDKILRFDFSHFAALTPEELETVELEVNREILRGEEIVTVETDINTAREMGAMALFGEKYGNLVRVVKMGDYSCELCGGTHLDNTAKAGLFKIISEASAAAGIRRIEATTGFGVLDMLRGKDELIKNTAAELKVANTADLPHRAAALTEEAKAASRRADELSARLAAKEAGNLIDSAVSVGTVRLIASKLSGTSADAARTLADELKAKYSDIVVVLATETDGKAGFVTAAGPDAVKAGAHAGKLAGAVAAVTGGRGGGRPDNAAAGAADLSKLDAAVAAAAELLGGMLK
ncbi:MAG: alanine--tRNA ligase [Clostridia bacterium]|nr:alanine--tRNA ligase [Clostridia bacterium]